MKWKSIKETPPFDVDYLCFIIRKNECGTFKKYQKVLTCDHAKFTVAENERVTHWMELPNEPDREVKLIQQW